MLASMGDAPEQFRYAVSDKIRDHAMTFPETVEGSSCVNRAFKAGGKNFAFLGEKDGECSLRLKLESSIPDLEERSSADSDRWQVGKGGWVLLKFPPGDAPKIAELRGWITESFRLLAPRKVVAQLD